ncbi:MAG: hypothetical protein SA339_08105 [Methanomassiliicoccus sp.]|nr:hypothetical protein [Methanomassiliicoccus sp.]
MGVIMWLPGHVAFSFLICLPFIVYLKRERALAISYLMVFALLPDFLHLGPLRYLSHSLVGLGVMLLIVLVPLVAISRPRPALLLLAVVAAGSHLLGDAYIGSVAPFYPWSLEWFQINEFNSAYDIRMEVVFFTIAFLITVIALRPWTAIRDISRYTKRERRGLMITSLPVWALSGLEGVYFIIVSQGPGLSGYRAVLLACFGAIFILSTIFLVTSVRRSDIKCQTVSV